MRVLFSVVRKRIGKDWKGMEGSGAEWTGLDGIGWERNGRERQGLTIASSILGEGVLQCGEEMERNGGDGRGKERRGMERRGGEWKGKG